MRPKAAITDQFEEHRDGRWRREGARQVETAADAERFNRLIEAHVRKVPAQYLWIHRRFKGLDPDYPDYYRRSRKG